MFRALVGYSMRSGSTVFQHILDQHSQVRSFSDLNSNWVLLRLAAGLAPRHNVCVKPMDLVYLRGGRGIERYFNRFIWLTRDPRDAYLSSIESGYAYLFQRRGRLSHGIDTNLLARWSRIHRRYFDDPDRWLLVRYEDLVADPEHTLGRVQEHLDLEPEKLLPFGRFKLRNGGDYKVRESTSVHSHSIGRHRRELSKPQRKLFEQHLGPEMVQLGYSP